MTMTDRIKELAHKFAKNDLVYAVELLHDIDDLDHDDQCAVVRNWFRKVRAETIAALVEL